MIARLSSPIARIRDRYTVVVVGSGYGGAVVASRVARAGQDVCVLERGKELRPGEYPDTQPEALHEMQADSAVGHLGSRTGLFDFRLNQDMNVLVGCGLGGSSLINANVSLKAEPRVFADGRWPEELRNDLETLLADGYRRAEEMLRPSPYPAGFPALRKLQTLERSAARLGAPFYRPPINVTFEDGVNHVGVEQHACKLAGDCVTGCNYGAKNTVLMNYLPDARTHGAELFTKVDVRWIERRDGRWLVHYQLLDTGRERFDAPELFVVADLVVLAAGALGSTEILLRSKACGLPLSDAVGAGFTGNGDVLAFAYNSDEPINSVGFGASPPDGREPVGPCIAGIIDLRDRPRLEDGMVIEDGSAPGALSAFLPQFLAASARLIGRDTDAGGPNALAEAAREVDSLLRGPYRGAVRNTQVYLVMAHDDGAGRMYLRDDRLRIDWPGVGRQPVFKQIAERLAEATEALGGTYLRNPLWTQLTRQDLVTVHPLGGTVMAEEAERGVVNHRGQVFTGSAGEEVHDGLYVCDGAVVPRPLGVNPLLTITALSERCSELIAGDRGWTVDYELKPGKAPPRPRAQRPGLQFTETMRGFFSTKVSDDYQPAAERGKADSSRLEFTLTVISDDVERMLAETQHEARLVGTVVAPQLSAGPLTVSDGVFNLFVEGPEGASARRMSYRMRLTSEEGKAYFFDGFKVIRNDPGFDEWADTTTLFVTVFDGVSDEASVLGRGVLTIAPADFLRQLRTIEVTNARSIAERLRTSARFGAFFAGSLFDIYGGVFARATQLKREAQPRKRRLLRVEAPDVHLFETGDRLQLRLTRFEGGSKGPVVLAHGFGTSSAVFTLDTIETNLVEYLFAQGYDVWVLDWRASIDLPTASHRFTADDVATYDWPAAIETVRAGAGRDTVQVVAQDVGSATLLMAALAGLGGVGRMVALQLGLHMEVPPASRMKAALRLPALADAIGFDSLTAYAGEHPDWMERLQDRLLERQAIEEEEERCASPVCRRATFMYGLLYEHDQLDPATHDTLHEFLGVANIGLLRHLSVIARKRRLTASDGADRYLPNLERLGFPIAFVHGAESEVLLPRGTELSYELLRGRFGDERASRHVVPGYGHLDCLIGANAAADVYPLIAAELEKSWSDGGPALGRPPALTEPQGAAGC